jgi:hypothetical protein
MAPKVEHLLDSSCYSVSYPLALSSELDANPHSFTSKMSSQNSSPAYSLPVYFPGSQQSLSLVDAPESIQLSESPITNSSPSDNLNLNYSPDNQLNYPLDDHSILPSDNNLPIDPNIFDSSGPLRLPSHFPPHVYNAIFSTPIKQRMGTSRLPNEQSSITVDKLAQLLHKELQDSRVYGPDFVPLIFPDRSLPIPVDSHLFEKLASANIWDPLRCRFSIKPHSYSENDVAKWLNRLADGIRNCFPGQTVKRVWSSGNKMVSPEGSAIIRKPDIILLNKVDATKIMSSQNTHKEKTQWAMILALCETTAESHFPKRMLDTIDGKSYIMFSVQHDRRFVPALCFDGRGQWSLTITDRQGQLITGAMSLRGLRYVGYFLRVFIALVFGRESHLGLDPNMIRDSNHHVFRILVDRNSYTVRRKIYSLQSLLGRGTQVWIVTRHGKPYVLKDAWVQASRVENENQHLEKIQSISTLKGKVPTLVAGEDVFIDESPDNTLWYRSELGLDDEHRVHRRVLTSDIGNSITTFTSKAEFIRAMIDIVKSTSSNNTLFY